MTSLSLERLVTYSFCKDTSPVKAFFDMFPITLKESHLQQIHDKHSQFNAIAMLGYFTISFLQKHKHTIISNKQ